MNCCACRVFDPNGENDPNDASRDERKNPNDENATGCPNAHRNGRNGESENESDGNGENDESGSSGEMNDSEMTDRDTHPREALWFHRSCYRDFRDFRFLHFRRRHHHLKEPYFCYLPRLPPDVDS